MKSKESKCLGQSESLKGSFSRNLTIINSSLFNFENPIIDRND